MAHQSVLLQEVVDGLSSKLGVMGGLVLDATVNGGGMSEAILSGFPQVRVLAMDADEEALSRARMRLQSFGDRVVFARANFRDLDKVLREKGIQTLSGAIFDLGLSSDQLENSGRGFSFKHQEPLLMTFAVTPEKGEPTAREAVNNWSAETLETVIRAYGEEKRARKIAQAILKAREWKPIETSEQLRQIIEEVLPVRGRGIHPATKVFQALRIAVNDELRALEEALSKIWVALLPESRLLVISFHSLEDRIVKRFMKGKALSGEGVLLNKKPLIPSSLEIERNPRSRSAKLRIIEKNN